MTVEVGGGRRYLLVVEARPVVAADSAAGVPPVSCAAVRVTEEAARWGLTGCSRTERRLRHPKTAPRREKKQH